jgi:basic membrane protein A
MCRPTPRPKSPNQEGPEDGTFSIWKGPIVGQDGKEVLKKDEVADDKFLAA